MSARSPNGAAPTQNQTPRLKTDTGPNAGTQELRFLALAESDSAQILGRGFPRLSVSNNLERDLLALIKALHPCAFNCADVYENIFAAAIWLDESVALLAIEPLHGSLRRHIALLSLRM
jgi:hypothetical protein